MASFKDTDIKRNLDYHAATTVPKPTDLAALVATVAFLALGTSMVTAWLDTGTPWRERLRNGPS